MASLTKSEDVLNSSRCRVRRLVVVYTIAAGEEARQWRICLEGEEARLRDLVCQPNCDAAVSVVRDEPRLAKGRDGRSCWTKWHAMRTCRSDRAWEALRHHPGQPVSTLIRPAEAEPEPYHSDARASHELGRSR